MTGSTAAATLLIGTRKGLVVGRSADRRRWEFDALRFTTTSIYTVGADPRPATPRLFASVDSGHFGPTLVHSDDLGRSWTEPEHAPVAFPTDTGETLRRVWQVVAGHDDQPGVVYAGTEPHALFRSTDGGEHFSLVRGLFDHPHRPSWQPGNGGACLHTVLPHPTDRQRMLVAMSAAGVYVTADGGSTWSPANTGIQSYWMPEGQRYPEFGQCVHRVAVHPAAPERLFAQNHFGVYRSENWGGEWKAIDAGLPATFGFTIAVHAASPETIFLLPLEADGDRMPPGNRLQVWRSGTAGASWEEASAGLPAGPYYAAVLRDALCTDPAGGVYFGSRAGDVFASLDAGETWQQLASHLPDVMSVRVLLT